jgi:hypothetical protein
MKSVDKYLKETISAAGIATTGTYESLPKKVPTLKSTTTKDKIKKEAKKYVNEKIKKLIATKSN